MENLRQDMYGKIECYKSTSLAPHNKIMNPGLNDEDPYHSAETNTKSDEGPESDQKIPICMLKSDVTQPFSHELKHALTREAQISQTCHSSSTLSTLALPSSGNNLSLSDSDSTGIKCENKLANSNLTMKPMSPVVPTCDSLAETSDGKLCLDQESAKDSKKKSLQEILAEGRTFKEFVPAQNSQISILSDNNLFCDNFSEFEPNSVDISSYSYPEEIFIYDTNQQTCEEFRPTLTETLQQTDDAYYYHGSENFVEDSSTQGYYFA